MANEESIRPQNGLQSALATSGGTATEVYVRAKADRGDFDATELLRGVDGAQ